jgi:glycosyltransferase involved in cell wall biosynthesis
MAAYNEEKSIDKAIQSIIDQTYTNWELIIVDDGSLDKTLSIIESFSQRDDRLKIIVNEINIGLPASLNKALSIAKGSYIARADADDLNLPERFEKQLRYMQKHQEIDVLGTGAILLDSKGKRVKEIHLPQSHEELKRQYFLKPILFHPSVMVKKDFFRKAGLYDTTYTRKEDRELWMRGLVKGCRYGNLQDALIEYQTNDYIRSWSSIISQANSSFRIAKNYKIKHGYVLTLFSFFLALSVKFGFRTPKALKKTLN